MDKDRKLPKPASFKSSESEQPLPGERASGSSSTKSLDDDFNAELAELQRRLQTQMRRPKADQDVISAAMQAVQRLTTETDAEEGVNDAMAEAGSSQGVCRACGHRNRQGYRFCGMCGLKVESAARQSRAASSPGDDFPAGFASLPRAPWVGEHSGQDAEQDVEPEPSTGREPGTHHYHHHYHHHYFPAGHEGAAPRGAFDAGRDADRPRPPVVARGESMSRSEAAVRSITQEWVLACNTKNLDNLLELYVSDALVLRSNIPPVRGAAGVREFFFGALDSGLGEVEIDPIRVDVVGDMAYEAGRCKALVPGATGKRREERGKYIWVLARQSNGEWKLVADCWSSDLTLNTIESDITPTPGAKPASSRKTV